MEKGITLKEAISRIRKQEQIIQEQQEIINDLYNKSCRCNHDTIEDIICGSSKVVWAQHFPGDGLEC